MNERMPEWLSRNLWCLKLQGWFCTKTIFSVQIHSDLRTFFLSPWVQIEGGQICRHKQDVLSRETAFIPLTFLFQMNVCKESNLEKNSWFVNPVCWFHKFQKINGTKGLLSRSKLKSVPASLRTTDRDVLLPVWYSTRADQPGSS